MRAKALFRFLHPTAAIPLAIVASGCLPAINHGPRVEEGRTFGAVGAYPVAIRPSLGDQPTPPVLAGPLGINLGHGWAAANRISPGYYLGLHVPILAIPYAQLDVYRQAPASTLEGFDLGVGANVGLWQAMPYVQFGRAEPGGSGWHTTQGVMFVRNSMTVQNWAHGWAWIPSLAYRWVAPGLSVELFVTGGYGSYTRSCDACGAEPQTRGQITVGGSVTAKRIETIRTQL